MRIAVMGAGGMGGYYGGKLAAAGEDVTFIARGAHLEAIQSKGLRLSADGGGDVLVSPAKATNDPATIGTVDTILFCTKLYDADAAAQSIRPIVGPSTMIVSLMNGVDGPTRIAEAVGPGHVLGGAAYASALITEPGVITYKNHNTSLIFGELSGGLSDRALAFQEVCGRAGFKGEATAEVSRVLWDKFVLLSTNAALTAITRKPAGTVYADPDLEALAVALMGETVAVSKAEGVTVSPDVIERSVKITKGFPPNMYASMYHDLARGRPMEVDSFSGLIARLGRKHGIPTPHHATIYACLKPYMQGSAA